MAESYRCLLHDEGREVRDAQRQRVIRRGISAERARAVLAEGGKLTVTDLIRLRVRYFTDGAIIGSKAFIEDIFQSQRGDFSPKRKRAAKPIREAAAEICTLRQLRVRPVG